MKPFKYNPPTPTWITETRNKPKVQVHIDGSGIRWWLKIVVAHRVLEERRTYSRKANAKRAAERVCEALGAEPEWM